METIKQQMGELKTVWADVYTGMRSNPAAWQPHLPNLYAEQIDEVIGTISTWLDRIIAPDGFKPSFHLGKGVVATALPQLIVTAKNLQKGEYNYLQSFVTGLNQILSSLHSMEVFSSKSVGKNLSADLAAQLSEALSLLGTAQRELGEKATALLQSAEIAKETEARAGAIKELESKSTTLLDQASKVAEKLASDTQNQSTKILTDAQAMATSAIAGLQAKITEFTSDTEAKLAKTNTSSDTAVATLIATLTDKTTQTVQNVGKLQEAAEGSLSKINANAEKSMEMKKRMEELVEKNAELQSTLTKQAQELSELQKDSKSQQTLIKELLPNAANAGLAAGFEDRADDLESTKRMWIGLFFVSILGLLAMAIWVATESKQSTELWLQTLQRLPFIAPFIWLGWFSAIQYGNTIRVQEDYAFKAATSKAFAGFRDHMEHLHSVNIGEGNNAMKLLAAKTIETLSHEPLRIFQKTDKDASPAGSILSMFGDKGSKKDSD